MPAPSNRSHAFADAMARIAILPASERVDALLEFFVDVLARMDANAIRRLRDQVMERFATCGCSFETCRLMIEFINGHLALRDVNANR